MSTKKIPVTVMLEIETIKDLQELADKDVRSRSAMAAKILKESLQAIREKMEQNDAN